MNQLSHEDYVLQSRARAVELAKRIVSTDAPVLEAAWELADLRHEVEVEQDDPDFQVFTAIQSDTEHLPIGKQRDLWGPEALAAKAAEIAEREAWAREDSKSACLNIIAKFATG